jgi:hypothetical protein
MIPGAIESIEAAEPIESLESLDALDGLDIIRDNIPAFRPFRSALRPFFPGIRA